MRKLLFSLLSVLFMVSAVPALADGILQLIVSPAFWGEPGDPWFSTPHTMPNQTKQIVTNEYWNRQKAMDLAYMEGKPWLEIQGRDGYNPTKLHLLIALNHSWPVEPSYLRELADEWRAEYDNDRRDAILWCTEQGRKAENCCEHKFWSQRQKDLDNSEISYAGGRDDTGFDDMRRWAYFWRFYGFDQSHYPPEKPETTTTDPDEGGQWGNIKANYR